MARARIRTIKPEFWTSDQIVECSTNARLMFIGLWNFCDDHGRHKFTPRQIKGEVFPCDDFTTDDVLRWLLELADNGLIAVYKDDDDTMYLQVLGWKHQKVDRAAEPLYPSMEECTCVDSTIIRRSFDDHSTTHRAKSAHILPDPILPDPTGSERTGKDPTGSETTTLCRVEATRPRSVSSVDAVVLHYQSYHPRSRPGRKERELIASRLKEGRSVQDLLDAIDGCHKSLWHAGANDRGKKFQSLELIMRDAKHVDEFLELNEAPVEVLSEKTKRTITAGESWLAKHQNGGTVCNPVTESDS